MHDQSDKFSFNWSLMNYYIEAPPDGHNEYGFMIHDDVYSSSLIEVQDYVHKYYDGLFDKLSPMKELNVEVDSATCNWISSNLYALETMSTITGNLETHYQGLIDTNNVYLKNNKTEYST